MLLLIAMGGIAGRRGGLFGVVLGAGLMTAIMLPIYLFGAYERGKISKTRAPSEGASK